LIFKQQIGFLLIPENPCVPGSIPGGTTAKKSKTT